MEYYPPRKYVLQYLRLLDCFTSVRKLPTIFKDWFDNVARRHQFITRSRLLSQFLDWPFCLFEGFVLFGIFKKYTNRQVYWQFYIVMLYMSLAKKLRDAPGLIFRIWMKLYIISSSWHYMRKNWIHYQINRCCNEKSDNWFQTLDVNRCLNKSSQTMMNNPIGWYINLDIFKTRATAKI